MDKDRKKHMEIIDAEDASADSFTVLVNVTLL